MIKSNRGQLSIFMGVSLILVMGMLAFIVNVGLFVKAKINLQNAVDAAAFSGAATQARQLTNIAYVNWEMRNTFKEWMFKYYVLGQMGQTLGTNRLSDSTLNSNQRTGFYLRTPNNSGVNLGFDKYNLPSVCISNSSDAVDICPLYTLPGIPRFPAIGAVGIADTHEALVNRLVQEKGKDCSARTGLNFLTILAWTYGSGLSTISDTPMIATNRPGAWPEALELGMRMRNLEMIVNRPPVASITFGNVSELAAASASIGLNERPVKAFMSAFRNLSGGKYKDDILSGSGKDELSLSFKLTELAPTAYLASPTSVSGFLIPNSFSYSTGQSALEKHYLDLQAVPVNYSTIFTTFATANSQFDTSTSSNATCFASRTAIPVPGYLLGFNKNPNVITYYAVKGEAEFTGLFFPKNKGTQKGSIKLTAYAAAKPFGGRIGPRLFGYSNADQSLIPREDQNSKSSGYITGLETQGNFQLGQPIPTTQSFWTKVGSIVGGVPEASDKPTFGIPNLIYDFRNDGDLDRQNTGGISTIQVIKARSGLNATIEETKGLYDSYQMIELKKNLGNVVSGSSMSSEDVTKTMTRARKVTRYDAANYLIPDSFANPDGARTNATPIVKFTAPVKGGIGHYYDLFAPILGEDLLYKTPNEVSTIVGSFMASNEKAVDVYLESLLEVANTIYNLPLPSGATTNINAEAAQSIHANAGVSNSIFPPDLSSGDPMATTGPGCRSDLASKFQHFFKKSQTQCSIVPLSALMVEYIAKKSQGNGAYYYTSTYYNEYAQQNPKMIMTAYYPSPRQGVNPDNNATAQNPIGAPTEPISMRRNFYSTKFIPLQKIMQNGGDYRSNVFLESDTEAPQDLRTINVHNLLQDSGDNNISGSFFEDF